MALKIKKVFNILQLIKNISVFRDVKTPSPFIDPLVPADSKEDQEVMKPDHVHLDSTGIGLGCCCLQVITFLYYNTTLLSLSSRTNYPTFLGYRIPIKYIFV